jgi:anti-anti-sigma factor
MTHQFEHIRVDRKGDVFCVRLKQKRLDESEVYRLSEELLCLVSEQNCRRLALSLGPEEPQCLYSVLLAKLITLRRRLLENGGALRLCDASVAVLDAFDACQLKEYFDFVPDMQRAIEELQHS